MWTIYFKLLLYSNHCKYLHIFHLKMSFRAMKSALTQHLQSGDWGILSSSLYLQHLQSFQTWEWQYNTSSGWPNIFALLNSFTTPLKPQQASQRHTWQRSVFGPTLVHLAVWTSLQLFEKDELCISEFYIPSYSATFIGHLVEYIIW